MKNHFMLLLTMGALLTYYPGYAQASADITRPPATNMVASVRTKPVSGRLVSDGATGGTIKKATVSKKEESSLNRFWSRIMGHCRDLNTASQKKS